MQEIAAGYVLQLLCQGSHSFPLPQTQDLQFVRLPSLLILQGIDNVRHVAKTLTKLCHVFMPASWRRKPSSGDKSTRYVYHSLLVVVFPQRCALQALQLLEYLVKNGSERVVDDARSHIATIKMLRNFYYIDEKGKDQGLNGTFILPRYLLRAAFLTYSAQLVRNRSRELVELLGDVEKIRGERRKAKTNKHKYTGTGNDGMSFGSSGGRYGGFGSDSFYSGGSGSGSGSGYGGGGGDYSGGGSRGAFCSQSSPSTIPDVPRTT